MRRLFWVGVGAVGTVVVAQRVRQAARRFTPEGVAEQAVDAGRRTGTALREAVVEFRVARAERESELVTALLVEPEGGTRAERRAAHDAHDHAPADPFARHSTFVDDEDEDDFF
jgi:hypothetical protein